MKIDKSTDTESSLWITTNMKNNIFAQTLMVLAKMLSSPA